MTITLTMTFISETQWDKNDKEVFPWLMRGVVVPQAAALGFYRKPLPWVLGLGFGFRWDGGVRSLRPRMRRCSRENTQGATALRSCITMPMATPFKTGWTDERW